MTTRLGAIFDQVWRWWPLTCGTLIVIAVGFFVVDCSAQSRRDQAFVRDRLRPLARWVETFRDARGRLPTGAEFGEWAARTHADEKTEYYPQQPGFVPDWGTPGRDFVVGVWRGQWMHYYRSWDQRDFAGEMAPASESPHPH